MGDWLLNLPVVVMGIVILLVCWSCTAVIHVVVTKLAVGARAQAFKAISGGILSPLAIIFALLVGFLAAQVWNDADRASGAVNREASSLRAVVLVAGAFPGETSSRMQALVREYIDDVVTREWPEMSRRDATLSIAPRKLADALHLTLTLVPQGEGQVVAQREMATALENALDARRQRIILSRSTVNWVKWTVLLMQAALTLIVIAMVHADNPAASRIILGIFSTGVAVAVLLIAAHSRPFSGSISVRPAYLQQVMPEAATH